MLYRPPERLEELCQPFHPLEFGYRFLLERSPIHTLSLGASQPEEFEVALRSLLPSESWAQESEQIRERLQQAMKTRLQSDQCSQCHACLPCPESINIPEALRLRNLDVAYDMHEYSQYRYNMFERSGHWFPGQLASSCTECGDCLPHCPENLDIPKLLFDTHDRLYIPSIRRLWE